MPPDPPRGSRAFGVRFATPKMKVWLRAYERDSHKHANTSIYERAYERDSHKHANTSIYERAYETPK
jgi:hypothetical protein